MKNKYFELAKKLSYKSSHPKHKLGCVIVNKNKIVSLGFNKIKTHPKSTARYNMLHAEIDALLGNSLNELKGSVAYVFRADKHGLEAMAKPCIECEKALREVGVCQVYYTTRLGRHKMLYNCTNDNQKGRFY